MAAFTFIGDDKPGRIALAAALGNAAARLDWLPPEAGGLPVTTGIARAGRGACYITNLVSAFFTYPAAEITATKPFAARGLHAGGLLACALGLGGARLIGNLPISTNLFAEDAAAVQGAVRYCLERHGSSWLGLRNLRPDRQPGLAAWLEEQGFSLLPARLVYEFATQQGSMPRASHFKRDLALLKRPDFLVVGHDDFDDAMISRISTLYRDTYIERHSSLNALYSAEFFELAWRNRALEFIGLVESATGLLQGFAAFYAAYGVLTVPALGHSADMPREAGLYRRLTALAIRKAAERRLLLNYSSGAGDAKRKRGAEARLEFTALRAPGIGGEIDWRTEAMRHVSAIMRRNVTPAVLLAAGA